MKKQKTEKKKKKKKQILNISSIKQTDSLLILLEYVSSLLGKTGGDFPKPTDVSAKETKYVVYKPF